MGGALDVKPSTPGQWSDEDEARLQGTNDSAVNGMSDKTGASLLIGKGVQGAMAAGKAVKGALGYDKGGTVLKNKGYKVKSLAGGGALTQPSATQAPAGPDQNEYGSWGAGTGEAGIPSQTGSVSSSPTSTTTPSTASPLAGPDDTGGGFGVSGGGAGPAGSYDGDTMYYADGGAIPDPGGTMPSDPDDPGDMQDDPTGQQGQAGDQGTDPDTSGTMGQQNQAPTQGTPPDILKALSTARQMSGLSDADFGAPAGGQVQSDNSSPDQGVQGAAAGGAIAPQPQSGGIPQPGAQQGGQKRNIMKYLTGASAMPQQTLKQAEQKVDPAGKLNPTARTMEVISLLAKQNPQAGAAALQAYRQQFNTMAAGARVSLRGGAKGPPNQKTAAQNATLALTNVPDGKNVAIMPNPDGKTFTAHIRSVGGQGAPPTLSKPGAQGAPQPQPQPQGGIQSQAGGGPIVEGFDGG